MSLIDKLQQIDQLQRQIAAKGMLSDVLLKKINYKFRLDWNYYSNSMEGNSLTRQETRSVMVGNITVDGKPIKDVLEMKGHDDVITKILNMGKGELNLSESRIRDIHKAILHEEDPEKAKLAGQWKTAANHLINYKGEKFDFVAPYEVPDRMHQLINWLNREKEKIARQAKDALHPVLMAFQFHLDYVTIHPFFDGNGRTARIFTNLILIAYGYPPIYIKNDEKIRYYQYLADIQGYGGSPELYYEFMAGLLLRSMGVVKDAIDGKDIEEGDDWEKKLSLLKLEVLSEAPVTYKTFAEQVKDVIEAFVLPSISRALIKFSKFDDLFLRRDLKFSINEKEVDAANVEALAAFLAKTKGVKDISFSYVLTDLKKAGTSFSIAATLRWFFSSGQYTLATNAFTRDAAYGHVYSDEEIDQMINEEASYILSSIKNQLQQSQS